MLRPIGLVLVVASGCTTLKLEQVRDTFARQSGCPASQVQIHEEQQGYSAEGCKKVGFCQSRTGPCEVKWSKAGALALARDTFAREASCAPLDIKVSESRRGFEVQGCGRIAVCAAAEGPCMAAEPLTCMELARDRHDLCISNAREAGTSGRNRGNSDVGIAGSIGASMAESRGIEDCTRSYDVDASNCTSAPRR